MGKLPITEKKIGAQQVEDGGVCCTLGIVNFVYGVACVSMPVHV